MGDNSKKGIKKGSNYKIKGNNNDGNQGFNKKIVRIIFFTTKKIVRCRFFFFKSEEKRQEKNMERIGGKTLPYSFFELH